MASVAEPLVLVIYLKFFTYHNKHLKIFYLKTNKAYIAYWPIRWIKHFGFRKIQIGKHTLNSELRIRLFEACHCLMLQISYSMVQLLIDSGFEFFCPLQ